MEKGDDCINFEQIRWKKTLTFMNSPHEIRNCCYAWFVQKYNYNTSKYITWKNRSKYFSFFEKSSACRVKIINTQVKMNSHTIPQKYICSRHIITHFRISKYKNRLQIHFHTATSKTYKQVFLAVFLARALYNILP